MGDGDLGAQQIPAGTTFPRTLVGPPVPPGGGSPELPHLVPAGGDQVRIGDDRAIPESPNWAAMSHQQLYDGVHQGNSPGDAQELARDWAAIGTEMAESSQDLGERVRGTESGWQGQAADAARSAISRLVSWSATVAATVSQMADRISDEAQIAENAKAAMPEPVVFNPAEELATAAAAGGISGLLAASIDVQQKTEQAQSAHDSAVHVMQTMDSDSRKIDANTPRFTMPPDVFRQTPGAEARPRQSTPDSVGPRQPPLVLGGVPPGKQQDDHSHGPGGTMSAGAGTDTPGPSSHPGTLGPVPNGDTSDGAAAFGGAAVGSMPSVAMAGAAGGGAPAPRPKDVPDTTGGGIPGSGTYGDSAGATKVNAVGAPGGGLPADTPPAASTAQASYTPPLTPTVDLSQFDQPNGSGTPAQGAHGDQGSGFQPGTPDRGSDRSNPSHGKPGQSNQKQEKNQALRNAASDPKYWASRFGMSGGNAPAGMHGSTDLSGIDGAGLPAGDLPGATNSTAADTALPPDIGALPGAGSSTAGLGSAGGPDGSQFSTGGITSMSGQLPSAGSARAVPGANHAATMGGAGSGTSAASPSGASGSSAMGGMGAGGMGQQGGAEQKERKSPGYITGEKIVEEPERVAPPVIGEAAKKKRP